MSEALDKLQVLAEQLDPLETSYADVRFLDVDYEQSEKQYETLMSDLRNEIDEENQQLELAKQLEAELAHLQKTIPQLDNVGELTQMSKHVLPELASTLDSLKHQRELANKQRRIVKPSFDMVIISLLLEFI